MSKRASTKKRPTRKATGYYQRAAEIESLFNNPDLNHDEEEVSLRLTEMAAWLINHSENGGKLAKDIYLAIGRTWKANRKAADHNERDGQTVGLHRELLEEFDYV